MNINNDIKELYWNKCQHDSISKLFVVLLWSHNIQQHLWGWLTAGPNVGVSECSAWSLSEEKKLFSFSISSTIPFLHLSFPHTNKFSRTHAVSNYVMLSYIFSFQHTSAGGSSPWQTFSSCSSVFTLPQLKQQRLAILILIVTLPLSPTSPATREKDPFPPSSLEHQNPPRPRSKPPSGKTAPRKEPRSATNSNNTVIPPVTPQQTTVPITTVSVNQVSF